MDTNEESTSAPPMDSVWDRWPVHPDRVRTVVDSVRRVDPFKAEILSFWPVCIAFLAGSMLTKLLLVTTFLTLTGRGIAWPVWVALPGLLGIPILGSMVALAMHRRWPLRRMDVERVAMSIKDRPVHRVCPGCGGDPFGSTRCCGTVPRHWSAEDLHVWWFEFSESGPAPPKDESGTSEPHDVARFQRAVELRRGRNLQCLTLSDWGIARDSRRLRILIAFALATAILAVEALDQWLNAGLATGGLDYAGLCILGGAVFASGMMALAERPQSLRHALELRPRCRKCGQTWGNSGIDRCSECGTQLAISTVRFGKEPRTGFQVMIIFGIGLGTMAVTLVALFQPPSVFDGDPERFVPTSRLIDLASRPIDESAWEDVVAELKSRSTDFTEEEWRAWGEALAAERVGLRYGTFWPLLRPLLERRWHVPVSPETERTLDDLLWNPDFIVADGPEPGLTRISWSSPAGTGRDAEPERKVIPLAMRLDGMALSLPETRPQQSTRTGDWLLDIPSSALADQALEIEALVYYERRMIPSRNRRGEVIEDPTRIEVPTMQADGTLLLPEHRWTRVITRTVRPSSPATTR